MLRPGLRSRADFARLWLGRHWKVAVALLVFVAGAVVYVEPASALPIAILSAIAGVITLIADTLAARDEARELQVVAAGPRDLSALEASPAYAGARVERVQDAHLLRDPNVDAALPGLATTLRVNRPAHDVPPELADIQLAVVRHFRQAGSLVFNGSAVRLETDLGYPAVAQTITTGAPLTVEVRETPFFAALATNEVTDLRIVSRRTRREIVDGLALLASRHGVIRDLSQSWLANVIGISTLAVTSDDHLLVVQQTARNAASPGRAAPSGSGSVDERDLKGAGDLAGMVIAAMERELREECNLPASIPIATRLTGFARWLERGGKPEFFGVSRIGVRAREVEQRRVAASERAYVGIVHALELAPLVASPTPAFPTQLGVPSVPLAAALDCLERARAVNRSVLDELV
ncbi:MAG TPA: hypothetical protein VFM58_07565 [Solirubrobacteraceae bacterium]|nr:hypothetical protein [Solirubrobacteraceae bacterium]